MGNVKKATYGNFVLKGIVTGVSREGAFTEGQKDGGNPWKKVQFSIKTSKTDFVHVELLGSKSKEVQFVYRDPSEGKRDFSKTLKVKWTDRYKERTDDYEIQNTIKVGLERDEDGKKKKENKTLVPYDAVEYIKKYLKDGESVFIRGRIEITEYNGKAPEIFKIQQIYVTNDLINLDADNFIKEASFDQEIVFVDCENEDNDTGKTFINTYIIYKKDNELRHVPYKFAIDSKKYEGDKEKYSSLQKLIQSFQKLTFGSTIRVSGNINFGVVLGREEETGDDFGGFAPEGQDNYVIKDYIKELEITKGDGSTLKRDYYTERDFEYQTNPFESEELFEDDSEDLPF
ncbi:hypothetical protein [Paenibacillus xylaniclasticus]|uniref:hypothetical protein n=1 Tax=Paenibacillus xylaniclasticus TaxID=588083 RepID=UPI000FD80A79|nr:MULTISPECIES: hypothetical protein [Paenibacillus]GFN32500.1 hypothetical protein PCURB6_27600 [Paenibacillus curdlanolyticus]